MKYPLKQYLGDGVYFERFEDRNYLKLTTENGIEVTNTILLDPEVIEALTEYINSLYGDPL